MSATAERKRDYAAERERSAQRKAEAASQPMKNEFEHVEYSAQPWDPNDPDWHRATVSPKEPGRMARFRRLGYVIDKEMTEASGFDSEEQVVMKLPREVKEARYAASCARAMEYGGANIDKGNVEQKGKLFKLNTKVEQGQEPLQDLLSLMPAEHPIDLSDDGDDEDLTDQ